MFAVSAQGTSIQVQKINGHQMVHQMVAFQLADLSGTTLELLVKPDG